MNTNDCKNRFFNSMLEQSCSNWVVSHFVACCWIPLLHVAPRNRVQNEDIVDIPIRDGIMIMSSIEKHAGTTIRRNHSGTQFSLVQTWQVVVAPLVRPLSLSELAPSSISYHSL